MFRAVDVKERLPQPGKDVNGFIMQEYSIPVTAFDKDGESYCGYFHYNSGLFYYRQIEGEQEGATRNITHWLEEIPAPAENEYFDEVCKFLKIYIEIDERNIELAQQMYEVRGKDLHGIERREELLAKAKSALSKMPK